MAFEGLRGAVGRGAGAAGSVIGATAQNRAVNLRERQLKAGQAEANIDRLNTMMQQDRDETLKKADALTAVAVKMIEDGRSNDPEFQKIVDGIPKALDSHGVRREGFIQSAIAGGVDPDDARRFGGAAEFRELHLPTYQAQIAGAQEAGFELISGERLKELAPDLPDGAIVQKDKSSDKVTLLFNPSDDDNASARKEQFDFLMRSGGITEEQAAGIVGGRFVVLADPITKEGGVFDKATGEKITGEAAPAPTGEVSPLVPTDIETGLATGVPGLGRQVFNTLVGAFNTDLPSPKAQEASNALETLQTFTSITLQAEVPGRPSNFLLEKLDKLSITPNSIFQGKQLAKSRLVQTKQIIDGEIERVEQLVLPQDLDPKTRVDTNINLTSLKRLSEAYGDLLDGFAAKEDTAPAELDIAAGVDEAAVRAAWPSLSDEDRAAFLPETGNGEN